MYNLASSKGLGSILGLTTIELYLEAKLNAEKALL
jgi:hypothetical protein